MDKFLSTQIFTDSLLVQPHICMSLEGKDNAE